jgi:type II secretory pathway pseudopilin PulG
MAEDNPKTPDRGPVPDPHAHKPQPPPDAHTRPGADTSAARPDQHEDLGPVPELFGAAGAEAHAYVSDDPGVTEDAIKRGAEVEGVESAQIFGLLLATIVVLILIVIGVIVMVMRLGQAEDAQRQAGLAYPELMELRQSEQQRLTTYGRQPGDEERYHIPLARAQEILASQARQQPAANAQQLPDSRVGFNLAFPRGAAPGVTAHAETEDQEDADATDTATDGEPATAPAGEPEPTEAPATPGATPPDDPAGEDGNAEPAG